jgi:hypothetical protein
MNEEEDEPDTIEYEKLHGAWSHCRQVGVEPGTLAESQFSSNNAKCTMTGHISYQLGPQLGKW